MAKKSSETNTEEQVKDQAKATQEEQQSSSGKSVEDQKSDKSKSKKEKKDKKYEEVISKMEEQVRGLQEKYLRLSAEFDNYRKRTLKEKADLLKSAGQDTITKVLPVLDDFERALISMEEARDIEAVKSGVDLIYSKFKEILTQQGLKEIPAKGEEFNTDMHEAITKIPAPDESLKGKIVDVVEKGYYLNDKVIRYSKVVIGE
jgi:molecular chaperone GrpE